MDVRLNGTDTYLICPADVAGVATSQGGNVTAAAANAVLATYNFQCYDSATGNKVRRTSSKLVICFGC